MKGSVKLFIASMFVFACALGFFAGALCFNNKAPAPCEKGMMMPPPPPGFEGKGPHMGPPPGFHGPRHGGPEMGERHQGGRGPKVAPEFLDSLLQVTAEQKELIQKQRATSDSTTKAIRKQRQEAEKQLREAMEAGNADQINAAKASVLASQSAMLDQRVNSYNALAGILSKEQMEKFRAFHNENMKNVHEGPHGPKGHGPKHGPKPGHEGFPPPPPQHK